MSKITISYKDAITLWRKEDPAAGFEFVETVDAFAEEEYHHFDLIIKDDKGNFYMTGGSVIACGPEQGSVGFMPDMDYWAKSDAIVEFDLCIKKTKTVEYWEVV